jgi:Uma2 family endonuclease
MTMLLAEKYVTADEFFAFIALPENDERRWEWEDGAIVDMGYSSRRNTVIGSRINYFISAFVLPNHLGIVTGADGGFYLKHIKRVRVPDTAFLSAAHGVELGDGAFQTAPDLAVEIVSEDEDIFRKAFEYLRAGTQIVWMVYPDEQRVYVAHLDEDGGMRARPYDMDATLDGGGVLPGFTLPVRDIFGAAA